MDLSRLQPAPHSSKRKKRVGRGEGSGHGKTACRGHKGQRARSGGGTRPGFEGGQMPLMRRVPKRGFHNPFRIRYAIVNLGQLEIFDPKTEVTSELLFSKGLVRNKKTPVKILGAGTLSKSLTVKANGFSAKARAKIESLGGKVEVITDA